MVVERLVATGVLSHDQYARLQGVYQQTNSMPLRKEIYRLLAALWKAPSSTTSVA